MSKITIFIIIAVIIVGAVLYSASNPTPQPQSVSAPMVKTQGTMPAVFAPNPKDASNAALKADVAAVDSQMSSLNGDVANVNQTVNDQPIDPTL